MTVIHIDNLQICHLKRFWYTTSPENQTIKSNRGHITSPVSTLPVQNCQKAVDKYTTLFVLKNKLTLESVSPSVMMANNWHITHPSTNVVKASRIKCSHNTSLTAFGIGTRWLMRSRCSSNRLSSYNTACASMCQHANGAEVTSYRQDTVMCKMNKQIWHTTIHLCKSGQICLWKKNLDQS